MYEIKETLLLKRTLQKNAKNKLIIYLQGKRHGKESNI